MNDDYDLFSALWKFFRAHREAAGTAADWEHIMQDAQEISNQFPTKFCERMLLCALDELEARSRNGPQQEQ